MSTFQGKDLIRVHNTSLIDVVKGVITELGWSIISRTDSSFNIREKDRFDYYNPLEMMIDINSHSGDEFELKVLARNEGYGPVQDEYIRSQVIRFIDAVRRASLGGGEDVNSRESEIDHSLAKELERLSWLHEEGELTDEEFRIAKDKVLRN